MQAILSHFLSLVNKKNDNFTMEKKLMKFFQNALCNAFILFGKKNSQIYPTMHPLNSYIRDKANSPNEISHSGNIFNNDELKNEIVSKNIKISKNIDPIINIKLIICKSIVDTFSVIVNARIKIIKIESIKFNDFDEEFC